MEQPRRHLNLEARKKLVRAQLILTPERSERPIARDLGISHTTVGKARNDLENGGQIGHRDTIIGADGVEQPRQHKQRSEWDKTESIREMPFEAPDTAETIPAPDPGDEGKAGPGTAYPDAGAVRSADRRRFKRRPRHG